MLLSRSSEYAIQALLYIAKYGKKPVLAREIADKQGLAYPFLGKILQSLVKGGFLSSQKGRGGGFSLAIPPNQIKLIQVVHTIEGPNAFDGCVLGLPGCGGLNPCPVHDLWMQTREQISDIFEYRTIAQLLDLVGPRISIKSIQEKA